MAMSRALSSTRRRLLELVTSDITPATAETAEILLDMDQMGQLLDGFEDLRKGRLVSAMEAFGDL